MAAPSGFDSYLAQIADDLHVFLAALDGEGEDADEGRDTQRDGVAAGVGVGAMSTSSSDSLLPSAKPRSVHPPTRFSHSLSISVFSLSLSSYLSQHIDAWVAVHVTSGHVGGGRE